MRLKPNQQVATGEDRDPRVYMAAERTFLAWIRTSLALMAFGFVVARVAVLMPAGPGPSAEFGSTTGGQSLWLGLGLIAAGIITCVVSAVRNERYVRAIDRGEFRRTFGSTFGVAIVVMLALIGGAMLIILARL